jgi:hypothetical protein
LSALHQLPRATTEAISVGGVGTRRTDRILHEAVGTQIPSI